MDGEGATEQGAMKRETEAGQAARKQVKEKLLQAARRKYFRTRVRSVKEKRLSYYCSVVAERRVA